MSTGSMDLFYPDPEDMVNPLCELCRSMRFCQCLHAIPHVPYVAASMLYNEPEPFHMPLPALCQTEADYAPLLDYVNEAPRQPLSKEHVRRINTKGTTVQPTTVGAHILDIYTPGDRLGEKSRAGPRKAPHKRQAPRPGGFRCEMEGCERAFDRACELNRHQKTHLDRSERPHKCSTCNEGFLYPKDLNRHQRKHIDQPSAQVTFFCNYPGCGNQGFSRRDNLLRHQRKQHPLIVAAA